VQNVSSFFMKIYSRKSSTQFQLSAIRVGHLIVLLYLNLDISVAFVFHPTIHLSIRTIF